MVRPGKERISLSSADNDEATQSQMTTHTDTRRTAAQDPRALAAGVEPKSR